MLQGFRPHPAFTVPLKYSTIRIWIHPSIIFRAHCSVHHLWSTAVLPPPTSHSLACSTPELSPSQNSRWSPDPRMSTVRMYPYPCFETEKQRCLIASHRVGNVAFQMTQALKQPHHTLPMLKILPLVSSSLRVDARRPPSCSCQRLLDGFKISACPEFSAKVVDSAYLPRLKVSTTRFFKIGPGLLKRKTRLLRPSFFSMKRFGPRWTTRTLNQSGSSSIVWRPQITVFAIVNVAGQPPNVVHSPDDDLPCVVDARYSLGYQTAQIFI
jgi:hypothetical protein